MENPASWKEAELIVLDALEEHDEMMAAGAIGLSTPALICQRLRAAGRLADSDEPEIGWDRLRARKQRNK